MKKTLFLFALLGSVMFVSPATARNHSRKAAEKIRTISVDYNRVKGDFNQMFRECVGAGRANEGLRADWQQQLAVAASRPVSLRWHDRHLHIPGTSD